MKHWKFLQTLNFDKQKSRKSITDNSGEETSHVSCKSTACDMMKMYTRCTTEFLFLHLVHYCRLLLLLRKRSTTAMSPGAGNCTDQRQTETRNGPHNKQWTTGWCGSWYALGRTCHHTDGNTLTRHFLVLSNWCWVHRLLGHEWTTGGRATNHSPPPWHTHARMHAHALGSFICMLVCAQVCVTTKLQVI